MQYSDNHIESTLIKRRNFIVVLESLLCCYIVLSPIYKCFPSLGIGGYNINTIVIGLLLTAYLIMAPYCLLSKQENFYSILVLIVFVSELILNNSQGKSVSLATLLGVFLYIFFLQTRREISLERCYSAFFISSIASATLSIIFGVVGGGIIRVATLIDGSIAPICIAIVLFKKDTDVRSIANKKNWKIATLIASLIILLFGMSRSRILLSGLLVVFFCVLRVKQSKGKIRIHTNTLLVLVFICFGFLAFGLIDSFSIINRLLNMNYGRFSLEGLTSSGRVDEFQYALHLFKENYWFGAGWGSYTFSDSFGSMVAYDNHSAYLAILARGGIVAGIAFFLSFFSLLRSGFRCLQSNSFVLVGVGVMLFLSLGNAGIFNYTICSIVPITVLNYRKEQ